VISQSIGIRIGAVLKQDSRPSLGKIKGWPNRNGQ